MFERRAVRADIFMMQIARNQFPGILSGVTRIVVREMPRVVLIIFVAWPA